MSRIKSVSVLAIVLGLVSAPLAFAQGGASTGSSAPATTPATSEAKAPAKATAKAMSYKRSAGVKLDLNSASREDLIKLPGVGEVIADKIIAARPLKAKDELVAKGIMTKAAFSKISSRVIAKQTPVASK